MVEELMFLDVTFEFSYRIRRFLKKVEEEIFLIKKIRLKYRKKKKKINDN